ncbi:MAG: PAS domain-containing protein [Bacteroidetes bacterium]|nr:PAS domain-containing protein [Bacteroidota bacterium]
MEELNKKEMIIRYGALGLSVGIALLLVIYVVLFQSVDERFTFQMVGTLHYRIWFLYIGDNIPLAATLIGAIIGNRHFRQIGILAGKVQKETEKNQEIRRFTHSLIAGDLNTSFTHTDADQTLSESLNMLRDTLVRNREVERQRRLDERQRNWLSQGLAEFGDILRTHSLDLESMGYAALSHLVSYLDANQGALYITSEDGKQLRMIACHAYERKKFPDKKIQWGEGLIGAVAMERKGFYTDKIPDGYLTITSGLGNANPKFLLIEPLIWNKQVFGIIEIASFKGLKEHELLFVARVAENIATTISTMESNLRTGQLLKETQAQAARLAQQEEQVRQNVEDLKQAQEEAAKHAEIFISFTNTVNHTLMRAEYDTGGNLLYANTRFLKKLGYQGNREVEGKHISMFINEKERPWFNSLWGKLSKGGRHYEGYMKHETKLGQDLWTMATYTCLRSEDGEVEKILFLAIDSTEQKKQSLDYEGQIDAIDRLNAKAVFTPDGKMMISNKLFSRTLKYSEPELEQMNVFDFFGTSEQERFTEIWDRVIRGEAFQGQLKMHSKYEEELWFRATFLSANDMYGEVEKVIFLASEITKEKEMEMASRRNHEQLIRKEEELRLAGLDLKKKLEDSNQLRREEKYRFGREVKQYTHVLDELPHSVITINNLGFILFFNRSAEKYWGVKVKDVAGKQVSSLFGKDPGSQVVAHFCDPARSKSPGLHPEQEFILSDGRTMRTDILLIRTDLKEELNYSMLILAPK